MTKAIVNIAIGSQTSWYFKGQDRLTESLDDVGYHGPVYSNRYRFPILRSVYEDKIFAIKNVAKTDLLLWLDCSITAVRPLQPIWDYIAQHGVYLYQSGANCAETCNDLCLDHYGISRDAAASIPECASNVVGINLKHPIGKKFFDLWVGSLQSAANFGVKWPTDEERLFESKDDRFKYHRQDQSTASLSAHLCGIKLEKEGHFVVRAENKEYYKNSDSVIFELRGGVGE